MIFIITCEDLSSSARARGFRFAIGTGGSGWREFPTGTIELTVWHEMGDPLQTESSTSRMEEASNFRRWF